MREIDAMTIADWGVDVEIPVVGEDLPQVVRMLFDAPLGETAIGGRGGAVETTTLWCLPDDIDELISEGTVLILEGEAFTVWEIVHHRAGAIELRVK